MGLRQPETGSECLHIPLHWYADMKCKYVAASHGGMSGQRLGQQIVRDLVVSISWYIQLELGDLLDLLLTALYNLHNSKLLLFCFYKILQ